MSQLNQRFRPVPIGLDRSSSYNTGSVAKHLPHAKLQRPSSPTPRHSFSNMHAGEIPGTRCGEIFVANNTRLWTFVCTLCQKSTQDIGDFIYHIQQQHSPESSSTYSNSYYDSDDEQEQLDQPELAEQQAHEQDSYVGGNDYMDCSSYLNVDLKANDGSVDVHAGETPRNAIQLKNAMSKYSNAIKTKHEKNPINKAKSSDDVVVLLDDEDDDQHDDTSEQKHASNDAEAQIMAHTSPRISFYNGKMQAVKQQGLLRASDNANRIVEYSHPANKLTAHSTFSSSTAEADANDDDNNDGQTLDETTTGEMDDDLQVMNITSAAELDEMYDQYGKRRPIRGRVHCVLCNKTFQYFSLYRNHLIKHSTDTPHACELCEKRFKSKQALRYHMTTHQRRSYRCGMCYANYALENLYIAHILTHEDASKGIFPCMVCGAVLNTVELREKHLRKHSEERPHSCPYCNKLFRMRHHLSNHLKLHRRYRCDKCGCPFVSSVSQRKPYACDMCRANKSAQQEEANVRMLNDEEYDDDVHGQLRFQQEKMADANMIKNNVEDEDDEIEDADLSEHEQMPTSYNNNDEDDDDDIEEVLPDDVLHARDNANSSAAPPEQQQTEEYEDDDSENYLIPLSSQPHAIIDNNEVQSRGQEQRHRRLKCTYCPRTYSHVAGLNYHIRNKHC